MSTRLVDLAAQLERKVRGDARDRVTAAVSPVLQRYGDSLRAALHPLVGHAADLIVADAMRQLRDDLMTGAGAVAERQAVAAAVDRLTTEVKPFALDAQQAAG